MENRDNIGPEKKSTAASKKSGKGVYTAIGLALALVIGAAWLITVQLEKPAGVSELASMRASSAASSALSGQGYSHGLSSELFGASESVSAAAPAAASSKADAAPAAASGSASAAEGSAQILFIAPVSGKIIRGHSGGLPVYSPTFSDWRVHNSVDIAGSAGDPVRAAASGTVTSITSDPLWGTKITITHDGGYVTTYACMGAKPTVNVDSVVEVGQVIGSIGDTAEAEYGDGPHLHFSVFRDGASVDPTELISSLAMQTQSE